MRREIKGLALAGLAALDLAATTAPADARVHGHRRGHYSHRRVGIGVGVAADTLSAGNLAAGTSAAVAVGSYDNPYYGGSGYYSGYGGSGRFVGYPGYRYYGY